MADYYVHHMSMFEHLLHKRDGFDVARNQSLVLSEAAFQGECFPAEGSRRSLKAQHKKHHTRGNGECVSLRVSACLCVSLRVSACVSVCLRMDPCASFCLANPLSPSTHSRAGT